MGSVDGWGFGVLWFGVLGCILLMVYSGFGYRVQDVFANAVSVVDTLDDLLSIDVSSTIVLGLSAVSVNTLFVMEGGPTP